MPTVTDPRDAQIASLSDALAKSDEAAKRLATEVTSARAAWDAAQAEIKRLTDLSAKLTAERDTALGEVSRLKEVVSTLTAERAALTSQLADEKTGRAEAAKASDRAAKDAAAEVQRLARVAKDVEGERDAAKAEREAMKAERDAAAKARAEAEQKRTEAEGRTTHLENHFANLARQGGASVAVAPDDPPAVVQAKQLAARRAAIDAEEAAIEATRRLEAAKAAEAAAMKGAHS